jgi:hypothetical protein
MEMQRGHKQNGSDSLCCTNAPTRATAPTLLPGTNTNMFCIKQTSLLAWFTPPTVGSEAHLPTRMAQARSVRVANQWTYSSCSFRAHLNPRSHRGTYIGESYATLLATWKGTRRRPESGTSRPHGNTSCGRSVRASRPVRP